MTTWVMPWRSRRSRKIELAVVAAAMDPARQPGGGARVGGAQLPAGVGAVGRGEAGRGVGHGRRIVVEAGSRHGPDRRRSQMLS